MADATGEAKEPSLRVGFDRRLKLEFPLVEPVDVHVDGLEVRLRADGLASLVAELRQQPVAAKAA